MVANRKWFYKIFAHNKLRDFISKPGMYFFMNARLSRRRPGSCANPARTNETLMPFLVVLFCFVFFATFTPSRTFDQSARTKNGGGEGRATLRTAQNVAKNTVLVVCVEEEEVGSNQSNRFAPKFEKRIFDHWRVLFTTKLQHV
jgi:hypothetical protein